MAYSTRMKNWPPSIAGTSIYLVGIKGTGMAALAELLVQQGAHVSGSDVDDVFYTDAILRSLNIPVFQGFSADNLPDDVAIVVHSAAWSVENHPELIKARARNLPIFEYTEALGAFSSRTDSSGIAGVHGKTTTTAMAGTLVKKLAMHGSVLVGSAVANFNGRSTFSQGNDFFIAETCEYRRHFLHFHPRRIIMTSLELDHTDYFKDYEDMADAFLSYALRLPEGGRFIYCADDAGACDIASRVSANRKDIALIPYGFSAEGDYRIVNYVCEAERQVFELDGFRNQAKSGNRSFVLKVPGKHNILNASAALALVTSIYTDRQGNLSPQIINSMAAGLESFRGCKRRSELIGEARGVLFMDDYAHHPTAIRTTLDGFKRFFPTRRIVVDFMSHTYSRTRSLLEEFVKSFSSADVVILHDIYASARELPDPTLTGEIFFRKTCEHHSQVHYVPQHKDALPLLEATLKPGDLFVTMGAGDNWKLGVQLFESWNNQTPHHEVPGAAS